MLKKIFRYKNLLLFLMIFSLSFFSANILLSANYNKTKSAEVRFLNKYTGKTGLVTLKVGEPYVFDSSLNVLLRTCYKSSLQDDPENKAFLQVARVVTTKNEQDIIKTLDIPFPKDFKIKTKEDETYNFIFSGWLFSSSPSVSYLEDKTYDITLLRCTNN